ncbi:MAG: SxtJ family membrane protein [Ignavibacteriaceae bacterium]
MIIEEIKHIKENKKDLQKFGYTVGVAFTILSVLLFVFDRHSYPYFCGIGIILIAAAASFPLALKPFNKVWMILSILLGWLMTRVILIILFYLAVTPISLLAKLFKKDFLDIKFDKSKETYWIKREQKKFDPADYEKQF